MTKLQQAQQRAVMMASALVTVLYSHMAFAGPREWWQKTKDTAELYKKGLDIKSHWESFLAGITSLQDFFGRSNAQAIFISLTTLGLTMIALRDWKKNPDSKLPAGFITSYVLAVVAGFLYEGLRTFPSTAPWAALLMLCVYCTLGLGVFFQWRLFLNLFTALREHKFLSFLRYRQLAIPVPAEGPASDLEEEEEEEDEEEDEDTEEEERVEEEDEDTGETEPQSASIACPHCGQQIPDDGVCCENCGGALVAEAVSAIACPHCGQQTLDDGVCCENCGGALVAEAGGHKPRARKRRKRGSYDPWS